MKKADIKVGGTYQAKVSGNLTTVRVDGIREVSKMKRRSAYASGGTHNLTTGEVYDVTNLKTNRKTTFRSAAKFRAEVKPLSDDDKKVVTENMRFSPHLTSAALVGRYPSVKFTQVESEAGDSFGYLLWQVTGPKHLVTKVRNRFTKEAQT